MITELISICGKLKITPNQYVLYQLINDKDIANSYKYVEEVGKFEPEDFKVLLRKEYIMPIHDSIIIKTERDEFKITDYELDGFFATSVVEDKLGTETILDKERMFDELFDTYPSSILFSGGQKGVAKACDKEKLKSVYLKSINNSQEKHNEIMRKLRLFIEASNGFAKVKIENFIRGEMWTQLDELIDNSKSNFTDYSEIV
jgi:hypothetical protein